MQEDLANGKFANRLDKICIHTDTEKMRQPGMCKLLNNITHQPCEQNTTESTNEEIRNKTRGGSKCNTG